MAQLPIDSILGDVEKAYRQQSNLIVTATPGAGKTTRIAPALLKSGAVPAGKKILMLQPRRLAAKAVAARIAEENNWKLGGNEVGYQVRFEKCFTANTQLVIMTEGILARKLVEDPTLSEVACVILDEFHERSLYTDLSLALLKELQSAYRSDLKIIVMSATLDSGPLQNYLPDTQSFQAEGQIFPLRTIYQPKADRRSFEKRLEDQVVDALSFLLSQVDDDQGNILIFLPGVGEIKRTHEKLRSLAAVKNFEILELHGSLSLQQQSAVLHRGQQRRIILSTNIAETSLTVPGVSAVIDSGLAKVVKWDPARNFEKMDLSRISLASAKQRAGRAAREKPGRVFKLWSQEEELLFKAFEDPEISRVDLAGTLLTLAAWGVSNFEQFNWFEKPSSARLQVSTQQLQSLRALNAQLQLTPLGKELQRIPLAPKLALALWEARKHGREEEMSIALALLGEKDPVLNQSKFKNLSPHERECDLSSRVSALQAVAHGENATVWGLDVAGSSRCLRLAQDLQKIAQSFAVGKSTANSQALAPLLWSAYSDRLCRRREKDSPRAVMVGGRGVQLSTDSEVQKSEFFLALELLDQNTKETRIHKASSLTLEEIKKLAGTEIREEIQSEIDFKTFKIQQSRQILFRDLIIEGPYPVVHKNNSASDESYQNLNASILKNWPHFVSRFPELTAFETRRAFVQKFCPEAELSDLADEVKSSLVTAVLEHAKQSSLESLDLDMLLQTFVPRSDMEQLNSLAPRSILVPSGRHIALEYFPDLEMVKCSVKLQELFGLATSPSILRGKVKILFDLLSPAQRPIQTTKDLASFWQNTYAEVRKELKIRYPRHPWPEDPWTAQATHKAKPRTPR